MKLRQLTGAFAMLLFGFSNTGSCDDLAVEQQTDMVVKGLNLGKYHQLVEDIRANPSHGRVEFRAVGESEEMVYHSTARIGPFSAAGEELGRARDYVLHLGLPVELQGDVNNPVDRIEPVELALAALTDCVIGTLRVHALLNGIEIENVSATIRAPLDLKVLLDIEGLDKRHEMYGSISIDMVIEGPNVTEEQRLFLSEQLKRSPVFNLVGLAHSMDTTVNIGKL
jgi:uncharacterized OsmC-like protein